ncbi:MAG: hypothetical protein GIW95_09395 [Candidatus Eremiobacteraeota bacterium]|nr:hypothetical protein [Candidatus Eremiobacteraeota bacterium]
MELQQHSGLAVVRARLPYVDRRSLSQAWFSSLHLAGAAPQSRQTRRSPSADAREPASQRAAARRGAALHAPADRCAPAGVRGRAAGTQLEESHALARRSPRARTLVRLPASAPARATFSIKLGTARIHVAMRRSGSTLHVVTLCSARHLEAVKAALERLAHELAAQGSLLQASVRALGGAA